MAIKVWLREDNEEVQVDDSICLIETELAIFEIMAEYEGILYIVETKGNTIYSGQLIAEIISKENNNSNENINFTSLEKPINNIQQNYKMETKTATEIREIRVTPFAESITEVTIGVWLKQNGDYVQLDEAMCEIETDKATQEFAAEVGGVLEIVADTGSLLQIGDLICKIHVSEQAPAAITESKPTTTPVIAQMQNSTETDTTTTYATGTPSPAASKILEEKGISTQDVNGTGIDGRITKADALNAQVKTDTNQSKVAVVNPTISTPIGERNEKRSRMTPLRKTIARRLVAVKNETAMLTTFNELNMKPVMDMRSKYKDQFKEKHGVGLGFMSFFIKACCNALRDFPQVNAMIDGDEMVLFDYCDISVAVSAPKGLVVPVIRNAEKMNFSEIELKIIELATKAKDNKLSIPDMEGGTFTITNGGIFGSMMSTPIINAPQSAILGMHNIVERALVINGEIVIRPMMYLALSYDHRIIDGREAVGFLVRVKQQLEEPERLLLSL